MADQQLRAGAAASNISPRLGVSLNGGMTDRTAENIHDELHARCLVLDNDQQRIAIVVCDSCMIPKSILDHAKHQAHSHTGILLDHMLISATHTHTAPTVAGVFQSDPDAQYAEFLASRISDGIRRALRNLQPAQVGWGVGTEPSQVFNRRWKMKAGAELSDPFGRGTDKVKMNPQPGSPELIEPAGPIDPEVAILALRRRDGRPLALLANYSLHYVGGTKAGDVSADYFGVFAEAIRRDLNAGDLDPQFVGIMSNGTSGNINNIDFRMDSPRHPPYEKMREVAALVSAEAARVYAKIEWHDWVPLAMLEARPKLGRRPIPKDELERAKFILSQAKEPVLQGLEQIYARETVLLNGYPAQVETVIQAARIGDLGIAASPCETFVETGLAIKEESPLKPTFTIELANDYAGYLPTLEHHRLGGYETWRARSSYLEEGAEEKIRTGILKLLSEVAG